MGIPPECRAEDVMSEAEAREEGIRVKLTVCLIESGERDWIGMGALGGLGEGQ